MLVLAKIRGKGKMIFQLIEWSKKQKRVRNQYLSEEVVAAEERDG